MKSFLSILSICATILFTSCTDLPEPLEPVKALKLSETEVSLKVNEIKTIKIISGNGAYKIKSNDFVKAVVNNGIIELTALKRGDTKISVTDAKNKTIEINVKLEEAVKALKLSEIKVSLKVNEIKTIKIISGNGAYKVKSNDFVKAVVNNEVIELKGLEGGDTKISVTDAKNKTIEINVNIKEAPLYPEKDIVLVESGTFKMENKEKGQSQEVTLSSFRISKYEVTNQQYAVFLNNIGADGNGIYNNIEYIWTGIGCDVVYDKANNEFKAKDGSQNKPVVQVTWAGANAYAKEAGGSLPTEAQWEYAARGGKKSKNYTYSGSNKIDDVSCSKNNSGLKIQPIGTKSANELGIYDMSGNVWEWCSDWYGDYQSGSLKDPKGPKSGTLRVNRGGGCKDEEKVSARSSLSPKYAYPVVGFRIVFPK